MVNTYTKRYYNSSVKLAFHNLVIYEWPIFPIYGGPTTAIVAAMKGMSFIQMSGHGPTMIYPPVYQTTNLFLPIVANVVAQEVEKN